MSVLLKLQESPPPAVKYVQCVEIYLPKRLKHLSELYGFLRDRTTDRIGEIVLDGFSIYEVDGVFRGKADIWEERSLVIRILFPLERETPPDIVQARIRALGRQIADTVATSEEEVWISHYSHQISIFRPNSKLII
jgi:hypothetical protein